jgi:PAS domain S-box-containing protein
MATPHSARPERVIEQLHHSEERFRLLVESVVDYAIFMLDPAGRVASWNAGAERIKGYRAREIVGQHFSRFYPVEVAACGKPQHDLDAAASAGRYEDEGWRVRKDGSRFWANVIITALRDGSGKLQGFGKVTRDLTERQLANAHIRESEARLQAFMNHSPSIIFIKDLEGRYQYVNDQFTRLFRLKRDAILSRTDTEILPREEAAQFQANDVSVLAAGEAIEFEETAHYETGEHISIVCKFPIRDSGGRVTALGGIVTDITERKQAEEKIRKLNEDLMRRIAQVETVHHELEALIYMVSHDFRPPLRQMEDFAKQVIEKLADTAYVAQRLDAIAQSASKLGDLTNDLLMYSRSSCLDMHRSEVDLNKIVNAVRLGLDNTAASRLIDWKIGTLPSVEGDPGLLRLVFENLLSNAVKFTSRREHAIIEVAATSAEGGEVVVLVKDNGAGFNPRLAHKLFGVFQRLHGNDEFEGAGIGLATVKRIVERLGGRVWAEGNDQGASFFVALKQAGGRDLA